MLAEVVTRATTQHISYMELMFGPDNGRAIGLGFRSGYHPDFATMRDRLLAAGLRDSLGVARRELDVAERRQRDLMNCGVTPVPAPCGTVVRTSTRCCAVFLPRRCSPRYSLLSSSRRWTIAS